MNHEHTKRNRHTPGTRHHAQIDRATRYPHPLARGWQQSTGNGLRRQTQFHAAYRTVSDDDRQGQRNA